MTRALSGSWPAELAVDDACGNDGTVDVLSYFV